VKGADVTLSGSVANWTERDLARHSAWGAAGVRRVVDHMSIAG
jgi:osmotically-inducible protein OsmY